MSPVSFESMTWSPKTDPATMRVQQPGSGKRRTLDEEKTQPGADRPQATPGGRKARLRKLLPDGQLGSRAAGVAMIFNLLEVAEGRWRKIHGPHLVPLVRAGAKFVNGELVERNKEKDAA